MGLRGRVWNTNKMQLRVSAEKAQLGKRTDFDSISCSKGSLFEIWKEAST